MFFALGPEKSVRAPTALKQNDFSCALFCVFKKNVKRSCCKMLILVIMPFEEVFELKENWIYLH